MVEPVVGDAREDVIDDALRILRARVVGGDDDLIGPAAGGARHARPLGGVAIAFDKLIACDTGNHRLQVFDARREDFAKWGKLIRVVPAHKRDGAVRFEAPRDVDVDSDGTVFVLDTGRLEVAVLSPRFERLGSFGGDQLLEPFALDASPDGRHCFVTDRRHNQVHHYVRGD